MTQLLVINQEPNLESMGWWALVMILLFAFGVWKTIIQLQKENSNHEEDNRISSTPIVKQNKSKSEPRRIGKTTPLTVDEFMEIDSSKIESKGERSLVEHIQERYLTDHIADIIMNK